MKISEKKYQELFMFLDDMMSEEQLFNKFGNTPELVYGIVAFNYFVNNGKLHSLNLFDIFVALIREEPKKQEDFDTVIDNIVENKEYQGVISERKAQLLEKVLKLK